MASPILKFFDSAHLPPRLQAIAEPFRTLAYRMEEELPGGEEKSAGLRKLIEAKDCFVRARLDEIDYQDDDA